MHGTVRRLGCRKRSGILVDCRAIIAEAKAPGVDVRCIQVGRCSRRAILPPPITPTRSLAATAAPDWTTPLFECLTLTLLYGPDENGVVWARVHYPVNTAVPDHADDDVLQFVEVASGRIVLNTEAGDLVLEEGDSVRLEPGLRHAWRTGDQEASLTVFAFVPGPSSSERAALKVRTSRRSRPAARAAHRGPDGESRS